MKGMRLAVVVLVVLLLGMACSQTTSRMVRSLPSPTSTPVVEYPPNTEVRFPEVAVLLRDAYWEGSTLITSWKITNIGTRRLAELQWQLAVWAEDRDGRLAREVPRSGILLPVTPTLYPGRELVRENYFLFDAPVEGAVINVTVSIGFLAAEVYYTRYKAPHP